MKPITELELRLELKDKEVGEYRVTAGTILTPSAREYLKARRVTLVEVPAGASAGPATVAPSTPSPTIAANRPPQAFTAPEDKVHARQAVAQAHTEAEKAALAKMAPSWPKDRRMIGPDGGYFEEKPEGLTNIYGLKLVPKDHVVIVYRGRLDSFCAKLVEAQLVGEREGRPDFTAEMEEILAFVRHLLSAELRNQPLGEFYLLGLTAADLRAQSHDPVKFFGYRHMMTTYKMGPLCVTLNSLRAEIREVELAAYTAFKNPDHTSQREDIIKALNRLSSLFYVMMFRYLPAGFVPDPSGI